MAHGDDERDRLAYALAQSDFDAVERGGVRAEWNEAGTAVEVRPVDREGRATIYDAEDLIRAESDREVRNARMPEEV